MARLTRLNRKIRANLLRAIQAIHAPIRIKISFAPPLSREFKSRDSHESDSRKSQDSQDSRESLESRQIFPICYAFIIFVAILGLIYILSAPGTIERAIAQKERFEILSFTELLALDFSAKVARLYATIHEYCWGFVSVALNLIFIFSFLRLYRVRVFYRLFVMLVLFFALFRVVIWLDVFVGLFALLAMQYIIYKRDKTLFNLIILIAFCAWCALGVCFVPFGKTLLRALQLPYILLICVCVMRVWQCNIAPKIMVVFIAIFGAFFIYAISQFYFMRVSWDNFVAYVEAQKAQYGAEIDIVYPAKDLQNRFFMIDNYFSAKNKSADDYWGLEFIFEVRSVRFE